MHRVLSRALRRARSEDAGVTLAELTVYTVLLGIVLTAITGFFIAFLRSSTNVRVSTLALDEAQSSLSQITQQVRNADQIAVTSGTALILRNYTVTGVQQCTGWYFDASGKALRTKQKNTVAGTTVLLGGAPATWTAQARDVAVVGSTPVFALAGDVLTVTFQVVPTGGSPTTLTTSVGTLTPSANAPSPTTACAA